MSEERKSIARSLGEFFGHIWKGATKPVEGERQIVREETEEEARETPQGNVTLRRTTIEEIEVHPPKEEP